MDEKRMAGSYEIMQALQVGRNEVVLGEDAHAAPGERYMCALCQKNELFAQYNHVMVSDDFLEMVKLYANRIEEQVEKTVESMKFPHLEGVSRDIIDPKEYEPLYYEDDLNDKVVVIKSDALRREYQQGPYQLRLCTGGFGASPKSRGSACFCRDLLTGKTSRFERLDIAGIYPMDKLPEWAKKGLEICRQKQAAELEGR